MALGLATPPQNSERNMPEGWPGFKLAGSEGLGSAPNPCFRDGSLLTGDSHAPAILGPASFIGGNALRALLPYEMTVTRSGETPTAAR
jgi:hypothetical protein